MHLLRKPVFNIVNDHLIAYPTPSTINYLWGFGSLSGICLGIQLVTGIFLAMHYTPHIDFAFLSVEHIMRDVNNGWLIRYLHSNGASMFFILVYTHIGRGLYYSSYLKPRIVLWFSGVAIFFLMMATAFIGYVLPWGQMSFWGATVITNLFTAVPLVGESIAFWIWGGFSVDNATLNRFFSLHYLLPFLITGLALLHLLLLHLDGSTNPLGIEEVIDRIYFYPYFYVKDLLGFLYFIFFYSIFLFFYPNLLGHSDNYIEANSMVTPVHIVPEWYFLPFYAILRSIPDKLGGVICMVLAILVLLVLPFVNFSYIRSPKFKPLFKFFFWLLIITVILLGWLGAQPVENPYIIISQLLTVYYFLFFLLILPLLSLWERYFINNFLAK